MAIGQVTISAADWLASRVSDRMALVVAGQQASLADQRGGRSVQPVEDNFRSQMEKRERDRSALAARESYMRVAAKIKSRIANRIDPDLSAAAIAKEAAEKREAVLESIKDSPGLLTAIIAAERTQTAETLKAENRAEHTAAPDETPLAFERMETAEDDKQRDAAESAYETGLWDDLFAARDLAERLTRE